MFLGGREIELFYEPSRTNRDPTPELMEANRVFEEYMRERFPTEPQEVLDMRKDVLAHLGDILMTWVRMVRIKTDVFGT